MSKIPWTGITVNPWVGCTKVADGCKNCYAEQMSSRLRAMGHRAYADVIGPHGKWTGRLGYQMDQLDKLKRMRKSRMVFLGSMSDLFHENVSFDDIAQVETVIRKCQQHTFQILTKRTQRMYDYFCRWMPNHYPPEMLKIPNLWLGTSISTQAAADKNIPILLQIPAAVRFLSLEPMLEQIIIPVEYLGKEVETGLGKGREKYLTDEQFISGDYPDYFLDWVIIGCESGPKRRPCKLEWVEDAVRQCTKAGVSVFVKQLEINGKVSHNPKEWPEWAQRQEYPEEATNG